MLAAVILSAGESSRMGTPKGLLPYRGSTFLEHLIGVTRHPKIGLSRVVLGATADEIRSRVKIPSESVVLNFNWRQGQLSSICAALRTLPGNTTEGILLCPVDHPLITAELVGELVDAFYKRKKHIVLPTYNGKRGHPVIFSRALYSELFRAPADQGARAVVWAHPKDLLEVPTKEEGVVLNLNDPETLARALESA